MNAHGGFTSASGSPWTAVPREHVIIIIIALTPMGGTRVEG